MKPVIICVDDEKIVLDSLRYQLPKVFGDQYDLEYAESGEEALEIVDELLEDDVEIPLVISDQIMPGMKGDELLITLANLCPSSKKILLTGQASIEDVGNAVNKAKLYRYISKPWDETDLSLTIKEACSSFFNEVEIIKKNIQLERLINELQDLNKNLESKVEERTKEIEIQKNIIEDKNKSIVESINYSKNIQEAMMPPKASLTKLFADSFIVFKPQSIVSGDFFWFEEVDNKSIVIAADCTGHGVPGAIMSMIGISGFNAAVSENKLTKPNEILSFVHNYLKKVLKQDQDHGVQDGMDVTVLTYDKENRVLEFAGAMNPLLLLQEGKEMEHIKGDRIPLGGVQYDSDPEFTLHSFTIDTPTSCYLLSDGFQDQFGGEANKKYTIRRLKEKIVEKRDLPLVGQGDFFDQEYENWKSNNKQIDDVLLIGMKIY